MNKTVLITGASRGIGRACAKLFAERGYNVVVNYNSSKAAAESLKEELAADGCGVICVKADVSKSGEVSAMVNTAIDTFGGINVLINNAGIAHFGLLTDVDDKKWNEIISTNLGGAFYCARAVLPGMIGKKNGRIINISSVWGICGASCETAYSASKAGIIGLTKALAKEVAPSGITVNCIAPGVINTDMNSNLTQNDVQALCDETPLGRLGEPEEIAALALFLAEKTGDFITGQVISPNGGFVI